MFSITARENLPNPSARLFSPCSLALLIGCNLDLVSTNIHAGFIDLGVIKGNIGDQNYALGSDLDLGKYRAVSIWCKRFSVNFGAAALKPTDSSQ